LGDKASGESGPGSNSIKSYLKLLFQEIDLIQDCYPLTTIYIGGGTPSLLTPSQINSLLNHLKNKFGFQDGSEITLEIDPASFTQNDLLAFLDAGINRISLGGQSFNDLVLKALGRRHRKDQLIEACSWLKKLFKEGELKSWSLDLIQNLPGHDLISWELDLKEAMRYLPPHISIYDLSIEPGTVFEWKQKRGELILPQEELALEMNRLTSSILSKSGLARYEISNYALPGHASRHNRVYWSGAGWWAFGMGATSAPWGERFARPRTRDKYFQWIMEQEINGLEPSLLSKNSKVFNFDDQLIVGLRRREGVNLETLAERWGWDQNQSDAYLQSLKLRWQKLINNDLLKHNGDRFFLSDPEGIELSNQILIEMLIWWDSLPASAVQPPNL
tara:strand:- start:2057 stop:3223 length:1167 start_codon:yes stop_codon:yes gene_type:complete